MKPGIESAVGIVEIVVTPEMTARLDDRELHPVYGTFWAGYHAEVASRRAIEPYFDDGENAVGSALELKHLAMAAIGAAVRITARVVSIDRNRILCEVEIIAKPSNVVLARGSQEQVLLPDSKLRELVQRAAR